MADIIGNTCHTYQEDQLNVVGWKFAYMHK